MPEALLPCLFVAAIKDDKIIEETTVIADLGFLELRVQIHVNGEGGIEVPET